MTELGNRYNDGKLRYDFVAPSLIEAVAKVGMAGAQKYAEDNWLKGMPYRTSYQSIMRHLQSWWQGEDLDPETGLPHLWHLAWNAMALVEMERRLKGGDLRLSPLDIDNRPYLQVDPQVGIEQSTGFDSFDDIFKLLNCFKRSPEI